MKSNQIAPVIWKSNDKNGKKEESVHKATSRIRDNKSWRETQSMSKQNPMKLMYSNTIVFTRSIVLSCPDIPSMYSFKDNSDGSD